MKGIKIQYDNQLKAIHAQSASHKSAFRQFTPEKEHLKQNQKIYQNLDMETYINKRKFQNSFTLDEISLTSAQQPIKELSRAHLLQEKPQILLSQNITKIQKPKFTIQHVFKENITTLTRNINTNYNKTVALWTRVFEITIHPKPKSQKTIKDKNTLKEEDITQSNTSEIFLEDFKQDSSEGEDSIKIQILPKNKKDKKKDKRQQKIQMNKDQTQKVEAIDYQEQKNLKKDLKSSVKTQKNQLSKQQKNHNSKNTMKKQNIPDFSEQMPFDGALHNCECCGKLISKLCFKCPHIYCLAQNCPRKRKKILNERMLERMKQQKIQEHYRQRQKYAKMKLQHGQEVTSQLRSTNKNRKKDRKKDDTSIQFYQCETSSEQQDSTNLYDDSNEQKNEKRPKNTAVHPMRVQKKGSQEKTSNKHKNNVGRSKNRNSKNKHEKQQKITAYSKDQRQNGPKDLQKIREKGRVQLYFDDESLQL